MQKEAEAVESFNRFVKDYPASELVVDVRFWFGEYYKSKGRYDKAREHFASIVKDYPSGDMVEEALYQLALTAMDDGKTDEAASRLEELTSRFPGSGSARAAYRKLAKMKKDAKDPDAAIAYFGKSLTGDNDEPNAQTQYEIAELYEQKPDLPKASEEYLKVPYLYGKGVFWSVRAQLRAAQIFERMDRIDDAKRLYEKLASMDVQESEFAKKRIEWLKYREQK
jgi:tol-pal system protein YbgF